MKGGRLNTLYVFTSDVISWSILTRAAIDVCSLVRCRKGKCSPAIISETLYQVTGHAASHFRCSQLLYVNMYHRRSGIKMTERGLTGMLLRIS